MRKLIITSLFLCVSVLTHASSVTPLPLSYGGLLYDINFPDGPGSHGTIDAGQWIPELQAFNAGAQAQNAITRLYPYSSDIEITCTNPDDISTCTILAGYQSGNASALAYANAFPTAHIMPIVDIAINYLNNKLLRTNTQLADEVAQKLATELCEDDYIAGVFFDIEASGGLDNPGIFEFYRQMSRLLASPMCVNASYPNGRTMGVYLTPVLTAWTKAQAMFAPNNNGFLAIPLYDISAFTSPPTPDALQLYSKYVTSSLNHAETFSLQHKVPYTIVVPAGASFGTFEKYGIYNPSAPDDFQLITDFSTTNATQLNFVQTARNIACVTNNPYFMGMDYWAWNQYVTPGRNPDGTYQLVMPNIPAGSVVTYLQNHASC